MHPAPVLARFHKARALQDGHVVGNRRSRKVQPPSEIAQAQLSGVEHPQKPKPLGLRESRSDLSQGFRARFINSMFRHVSKYTTCRIAVQGGRRPTASAKGDGGCAQRTDQSLRATSKNTGNVRSIPAISLRISKTVAMSSAWNPATST